MEKQQISESTDQNQGRWATLEQGINATEAFLKKLAENSFDEFFYVIFDTYLELTKGIQLIFEQRVGRLKHIPAEEYERMREEEAQMLEDIRVLLDEFQQQQASIIHTYWETGIANYLQRIDAFVLESPEEVQHVWEVEALEPRAEDDRAVRRRKAMARMRSKLNGGRLEETLPLRMLLSFYLRYLLLQQFGQYVKALHLGAYELSREIGKGLSHCCDEWDEHLKRQEEAPQGADDGHDLALWKSLKPVLEALGQAIKVRQHYYRSFLEEIHGRYTSLLQEVLHTLSHPSLVRRHERLLDGLQNQVKGTADAWQEGQVYWHNELMATSILLSVRVRLRQLATVVKADIRSRFFEDLAAKVEGLQAHIEALRETENPAEESDITHQSFLISEYLFTSGSQLIEDTLSKAHAAIDDLPVSIQLLPSESLDAKPVSLALASVGDYLTQTHFFGPLQVQLQQLPSRFKRFYLRIQDATRLIAFNLNPERLEKEAARSNLDIVLQKAEEEVRGVRLQLRHLFEELEEDIDDQLEITLRYLSLEEIQKTSEDLRGSIRGEARLRFRGRLRTFRQRVLDRLNSSLQRLGIKSSHFIPSDWQTDVGLDQSLHARLRDFVEEVTPKPRVLSSIPFYYQQLFVGKEIMLTGPLKHREQSLQQAERAATRLQQRLGGAMMVTGEPLCGKSYFCHKVASLCFAGNHYFIKPPLAGSIHASELTRAFQQSLNAKGSLQQIIESAPIQTVFIFDDLELWWERSPKGSQVLQKILGLISQYGRDYFFVLNCNQFSLQLFQQLTNISHHLVSTISLPPLTPKQVKSVVMDRHYSGGIPLSWKGRTYDQLKPKEVNALFKRHQQLSGGNVGAALRLWLSSIEAASDELIEVREPVIPAMPLIKEMDWMVLLCQFVLHKRLRLSQLTRVYDPATADLEHLLSSLLRAGLIEEQVNQTYQLNPYLIRPIIRQLKQSHLL